MFVKINTYKDSYKFGDVARQRPPIAVINVTPRVVVLPSNSSSHSPGFAEIFLQLLGLHVLYKKFPTHEEALVDPQSGIELPDWVKLCDKFAIEKFQLSEQNRKNHSTALSRCVDTNFEPKKKVLVMENLRTIVELKKKKSAALEEKLKEVTLEQDEMKNVWD
ncbi:hypothetical protein Tco_0814228 [Tanacetum coccineum]